MDEAVFEWLLTCPKLQELGYQFGEIRSDSALLYYDNETPLKIYNDGSSDRLAVYQIAPFTCLSEDAKENIDTMAAPLCAMCFCPYPRRRSPRLRSWTLWVFRFTIHKAK